MANPKQLIDIAYSVFADNNLSRILPVLDEKIVLYIAQYGPTGREYQGRSGFLAMMSELYTICEDLRVHSLIDFTPDDDQHPDSIITTGFFEGKLLIDNEPFSLPFVHTWYVKADRVVELRAFYWDSAQLFYRIQQGVNGPDFPSNGQHRSSNGTH
ncbi:nuclear transport factor 2 family protein [Spirosoma foliorum]|uniref:Nuclear transport factor 2 family protein n=1 Tax=Spirosoma foliorum TaxID=2710596 RepID=A0A7G5H171_9BACT|nr:nuclear transport factor 2 family protein [Spirosoma foliorum]QMW04863.1 nuclear transport factor 2 family protein [Spirosoma foliorum]